MNGVRKICCTEYLRDLSHFLLKFDCVFMPLVENTFHGQPSKDRISY